MDSLRRCHAVAAALALFVAPIACQSSEVTHGGFADSGPAPSSAISPYSLRVPTERLTRVELSKSGTASAARSTRLDKEATGWRLTTPVSYQANPTAMDSIIAVLAELEVTSVSEGGDRTASKHGLAPGTAIEVRAWTGDHLESHFLVGHSSREQTYVQRVGDSRVLTVRGRCRQLLDKTVDELRHPVITDVPVAQIEGALYTNPFGRWELRADPAALGRFVVKGRPIRNFDGNRASKNVAVLAHLFAKGFVDAQKDSAATGLFRDDTPRATLLLRGNDGPRSIDIWVGKPTADGRLHVRTSESEQIYLVSSHLESTLVPRSSHFERSDEMMRELAAHRDQGGPAHTHEHPGAAPSQVPPALLDELRALAKSQRVP